MPWHVDPTARFEEKSTEADDNAKMIYSVLSEKGWTKNAVAGLLGNIQHEGIMNPWMWQDRNVQPTTGNPWYNIGYGLVQFTNAGKYINNASGYDGYGPNFSDQTGSTLDGQAQMLYLNDNADYSRTDSYPLTFEEYKVSTLGADYLAEVWLYNYERPGDPASTVDIRKSSALYYYDNVLNGDTPSPEPPTPTPTETHKMKWIFYMGKRWII